MSKLTRIIILALIIIIFLFPQSVRAENAEKLKNYYEYFYIVVIDESVEEWRSQGISFFGKFEVEEYAYILFDNLFSEKQASFVPDGVAVLGAEFVDGHLVLNVSEEINNHGGAYYEERLVSYILKTAFAINEVESFSLMIDGELGVLSEGLILEEVSKEHFFNSETEGESE